MSVHPRWRGEHALARCVTASTSGSSPLARGTLRRLQARRCGYRFIPAGAGNTFCRVLQAKPRAVHPRWRGEHELTGFLALAGDGSSPLARGTPALAETFNDRMRFIPAGAGNTMHAWTWPTATAVHPRWRGEHSARLGSARLRGGSSPLARGTPFRLDNGAADRRFIPAGAGNTD